MSEESHKGVAEEKGAEERAGEREIDKEVMGEQENGM